MAVDPLTPRNLAAAFAVGGLVVMMIQDTPNWHAIVVALMCLVAFAGLRLLPQRRQVFTSAPRKIRIEIIPPDAAKARTTRLLESTPRGLDLLGPARPQEISGLQRWQKPRWK